VVNTVPGFLYFGLSGTRLRNHPFSLSILIINSTLGKSFFAEIFTGKFHKSACSGMAGFRHGPANHRPQLKWTVWTVVDGMDCDETVELELLPGIITDPVLRADTIQSFRNFILCPSMIIILSMKSVIIHRANSSAAAHFCAPSALRKGSSFSHSNSPRRRH